ncbi:transposase [Rugosimonospora africana]|uniref:Transposase n=1 Tax=Rugosimonospora africana TaxID=556532 RepID=A0A8J3VW02_9ACTN|nr:transposase [Rugosimonospora africana]
MWACLLEINRWRRHRQGSLLVGYQELCRELSGAGPGTFGELDSVAARSVLRRYSDAWFAAAKRRNGGDQNTRYPRRRRGLMPVRWYHGTFTLAGRRLRLPTGAGCWPLWVRLDRAISYPVEQVRSVTLLSVGGRLAVEVTAEVPVVTYPAGLGPQACRVAGVDPGIIDPYAVAGPDRRGLLVSGRAIRAEHYQHLRETRYRNRAVAARAPKPGQRGSRRWKQYRRRRHQVEHRHRRRVRQAQHEAARTVVDWAVAHWVGTLTIGDPRTVLEKPAGRRHNLRLRQWQIGRAINVLRDKAELAGITVHLVGERGTSSTCPTCAQRIPKPRGRALSCPRCQSTGHRDLVAAAIIGARTPGGAIITSGSVPLPEVITHRRAGRHLPGAGQSRRDPRRRPLAAALGPVGQPWPAPPPTVLGSRSTATKRRGSTTPTPEGKGQWTRH